MSDDPNGRMILAVASSTERVLDLFATDSWEHLGRVSDLIAEPHEIAADERRRLLYIVHTWRGGAYMTGHEPAYEMSVVDVDRRAVVDVVDLHPFASPHDVEYCEADDLIYASVEANDAGNGVVIIDPRTRTLVGSIATPAPNAHWLAISPDGSKGYVSHKEGPLLSVLDLRARETVATIELPGGAEEVCISTDGSAVFVVTPWQTPPSTRPAGPSRVLRIDTASDAVSGEIELEPTLTAIRATSTGKVLVSQWCPGDPGPVFAGAQIPGALHVVDGATMALLGRVELDRLSFTVRASADGSTAYVANLGAGTLSVVDVERCLLERTIDCTPNDRLGGTHGLALISAG